MAYDATHRLLLRTLLARGVLSLPEAERLLREHAEDELAIRDVVKIINEQIRPFQQNIKIATDEATEEQALVFLSLGLDDISKSQTVFAQQELQYFRVLLEQIVTTEQRQVSGIAALNLVSTLKATLTKHDAQKLLATWCDMRYLHKTGGAYGLGLRAVHEFEGYMRRNLPDAIEDCSLCKLVVFRGCNCPGCGLAVHTHCLNKYLEKVQSWPCCKAQFNGMPEAGDTTVRRRHEIPNTSQEDIAGLSQVDMTETSQVDIPETSHVYRHVQSSSPVYDPEDTAGPSQLSQESVDEDGLTQASALGISQTSVVRKRKRQW